MACLALTALIVTLIAIPFAVAESIAWIILLIVAIFLLLWTIIYNVPRWIYLFYKKQELKKKLKDVEKAIGAKKNGKNK